jgi:hypothetical protein
MSNKPPATLWTEHGYSDLSVAEFIQQRVSQFTDLLYWLEPAIQLNTDGSKGRLNEFVPFAKGQLPEKLPTLEAAYLFGLQHSLPMGLHCVASENGCRWFAFQTVQTDTGKKVELQEQCYSTFTRGDFKRFFGNDPQWIKSLDKLKMIEYWDEQGLLTWWMHKG